MQTKRKFKLKPKALKILKIIGIIIGIILIIFLFYEKNIHDLTKLGYNKKSSKNILLKFKKKDIVQIGKNKTMNKAFESNYYEDKNFNTYSKIKYHNHKNLIKNINKMIKVGYSNDQINMILEHGSDKDVSEFVKRKKVRYLEEFYTVKYAKLKNYDRYVSYMNESREDEETSVLYVNLNLDKEDYKDYVTVKDFSYTMLVNKHRKLTKNFNSNDLISISKDYASEKGLKGNRTAVKHLEDMIKQAEKEGYGLVVNSAFRSYEDQDEIVNTYKALYGDDYVAKYVLMAGFSEHQTGLGFDMGSKSEKTFAQSKEYKWVVENCYKYGFIYRFKPDYEDITGIKHEAWHYRYVGKKVAKYIYDHDISLEEYYAMFLDNN